MARIRTIKPDFWEDEVIASLTPRARLLFIGTWNFADDDGRLRWTSDYLKASVFMYDALTIKQIDALMAELVVAGLVVPYSGGKAQQRLAHIPNFLKHQKINRPQPSRLPAPDRDVNDSRNDSVNGSVNDSPQVDDPFTTGMEEEWNKEEEGEQQREPVRTHHGLLRPDAPPLLLSELDDLINALLAVHDGELVDAAIRQLTDQRLRFPFPSDVRRALEQILGRPAIVKPSALDETQQAQHAAMDRTARRKRGEVCPFCEDRGVVELEDGTFDDCRCKSLRSA